jgi:hypothetical protein
MNFDRYNCLWFEMNKKVSKHISLKWNKSELSQSGVQVFPRLSSRLIFLTNRVIPYFAPHTHIAERICHYQSFGYLLSTLLEVFVLNIIY